ncbi:hypothetical protein Trco_003182 [Trichoderma cornu-damae]|uniref:Uncharacterized protein n=1 Tax=Trichoderma cornu-damae TaxID=654480 RepID=A0A9P8QP63_9HYPO|nr:hypothetical protein Trco_003182 [Trichoderma cornu-damae]
MPLGSCQLQFAGKPQPETPLDRALKRSRLWVPSLGGGQSRANDGAKRNAKQPFFTRCEERT